VGRSGDGGDGGLRRRAALGRDGVRYLTNGGLLEIGTAFTRQPFRADGVRYLQLLEVSPDVEIVEMTADLYAAGPARFAARPGKDWGLVDCASFARTASRGVTDALTADAHFARAGFAALLG
jgi:hypothetical protein